jgi:hypothetical protein
MNADDYNHCSVCIEADRLAPVAARANSLIRASTGKPINYARDLPSIELVIEALRGS